MKRRKPPRPRAVAVRDSARGVDMTSLLITYPPPGGGGGGPSFTPVGFGKNALSGTARSDYHVTDTGNGTGTGTLRAALSASNRNVIFDVDTVTIATTPIQLNSLSNIVIDGSSRSNGVTISGQSLRFDGCSNVVIRDLALRACPDAWEGAIQLRKGSHDFLIDRCSISGWSWRGIDIHGDLVNGGSGNYNVTVQWCFFGGYTNWGAPSYDYPLYVSDESDRVSVDHCVFYNSVYRQPQASYDYGGSSGYPTNVCLDVANCLMWSENSSYYSFINSHDKSKVNVRQSWFHATAQTAANYAIHTETNGYVYQSGCTGDGVSLSTNNVAGSAYSTTGYDLPLESTAIVAAQEALAHAGRYPRDSTDTAFAANISVT